MKRCTCLLSVVLFCALAALAAQPPDTPIPAIPVPDFSQATALPVVRVTDGDTIAVLRDGAEVKVRLVGVDTPETVHPTKPVQAYGKEASRFLANLLAGEKVYLFKNPDATEPTDRYGRLLAFVYRAPDGLFVNAEIIRQGYGHAYTEYPFPYMDEFRQLERLAREAGKGLWGQAEPVAATPPPVAPPAVTPPTPQTEGERPLPVTGEETPLTRVEANTREYIGRAFIIIGGICVKDYYNYGYSDAKSTHVSLDLRELRADRTFTRKHISAYLRHDLSKPLVDAIVEEVAKGVTHKIIRAKLTFLPERYEEFGGARVAELLDWQFLDSGKNDWGPWARGIADSAVKPQPQPADDPTVYVTKTGAKYHLAGCRYLSKSAIPMKLSEAKARYGPCSVCKPPQ